VSQQRLASPVPPRLLPGADLDEHVAQPVPGADYILYCAFGPGADAERSEAQLREALVRAGFFLRATRYLVRSSPLLQRSAKGLFHLREEKLSIAVDR
jgi:hypothetical protein